MSSLVNDQKEEKASKEETNIIDESERNKQFALKLKNEIILALENNTIQEMDKRLKVLELLKKIEKSDYTSEYLKEIKNEDFVTKDNKLYHLIYIILRNSELLEFQKNLQNALDTFNKQKLEELLAEKDRQNYVINGELCQSAVETLEKLKNDPDFANEKLGNAKKITKNKLNKN